MLGETQWQWLEDQLGHSPADLNIVVSSIQVLTTNPLVESWGHFPHAKARLLDLLVRTRPKHLLLLSGDVHFAELLGNPPIELTSSGMTHTCGTTFWARACGPLIRAFPRHRRHTPSYLGRQGNGDESEWEGSGEGFFTGYNFGFVEVEGNETTGLATVWASALDADGVEHLRVQIPEDSTESLIDALSAMDEQWQQGKFRLRSPTVSLSSLRACVAYALK